ncbi:hypothetical protein N0V93_008882 [Gnomoniopsis smithogilvyi]|uniref:Copper acquisition factor BIM1-like domain-containing protein n=1 Tax=Gnomoniopsis smithogilvyi TaxID=1191159 RepID=A0A9W9CSA2_9PEZI|nr:hypothetical protein N0V93_008882 [Gnomoniopsis smithogilvyi]
MLSSPLVALLSAATLTSAHTVITYPGWRGDNLVTNDTFPYGMQWMYPCGGHPMLGNRTYWPTTGGAVALQPGWFQGHQTAFMYINLGYGTDGPDGGPPNMSNPMVSPFQIVGPSANPYPGTICLPEVPLPANASVKAGDNATIQVVEIAKHGAALFSCVDITFAEPGDSRIAEVNESNCFNSNDMGFADVYTVVTRASDADPNVTSDATETFFWYFNKHGGSRQSLWNYLGVAPALFGLAMMLL